MICCLLDFNFPFTFHNCEPQPPSVLWIWMRTFIQQFSAIFAVVIPFLCVCPPVSENKWKAEDDMFWLFLSAWRSGNPLCTDKFPTSTDETFSVFLVNVLVLSGEWKKKKSLLGGNKANILFGGLLKACGGCSVEALARSYELWCLLSLFPPKQSGILKFM